MSKLQAELSKLTDIEPKKNEERADFLGRIGKAVGALEDADWEKMSPKAQDWFNDNADARNKAKKAGKDVPDWTEFPDYEAPKAEKEETSSRRRRSDDDGDEKPAKGDKAVGGPDVLKEGLVCTIETSRGKSYTGEVIELSKKDVVIKDAEGEETEISVEKVLKVTFDVPAEKEEKKASRRSAEKDEEEAVLGVGATVKVTTKRGKEFEGEVTELTEDEIVIKTEDDTEELRRDRIESIKVLKGAKAEKKAEGKGKGKESDDDGDEKPTRARNTGGVSIAAKIAELMIDNLDATEEEIGKMLKKDDFEFKPNTLGLNFAATKKILDILKAKGKLKK